MINRNKFLSSAATFAVANEGNAGAVKARDISADKVAATARTMADRFSEDDGALAVFDEAIKAKETTAISPVNIYLHLIGMFTPEELAATPVPGTPIKFKDEDGVEVFVNNPDQYEAPRDGSTGTVKKYWTNDFADALPQGKAINDKLEAANKLKESDKRGATLDINKYTAQRTTLRRLVKQGFGLVHQISAAEAYPGATFEWVYEADGETIRRTNKPIIVGNRKGREFSDYTVQQFLALDYKEATTSDWSNEGATTLKAGTYDRLLKTAGRGGNQGGDGDEDAIKDVDAFSTIAANVLNYADEDDGYTAIKRRARKDDDFLSTLWDLSNRLDELFSDEALMTKAKALAKANSEAAKAA